MALKSDWQPQVALLSLSIISYLLSERQDLSLRQLFVEYFRKFSFVEKLFCENGNTGMQETETHCCVSN